MNMFRRSPGVRINESREYVCSLESFKLFLDPRFVEKVPVRVDAFRPTDVKCLRCWKYTSFDVDGEMCMRCFNIIWDYNQRRNIVLDPDAQRKPRRY